jgi:hypothetical protein
VPALIECPSRDSVTGVLLSSFVRSCAGAASSRVGAAFLAALFVACGTGAASSSTTSGSAGAGGSTTTSGGGGGFDPGNGGGGGSAACDGGVADVTPTPCDASADVSFTNDVAPILTGCTGELCHGPWKYATVVSKPATECCDGRMLVAPGDPARSYLLDKIRDHELCKGAPMPLGLPPLPDAKAQAIADWICLGAPKN